MTPAIWTASYVYTDRPHAGYALLVSGGRVEAAAPLAELSARHPSLPVENKGFYLGPAPANAHTHLDLGLLPTFKGSFADFLEYVVSRAELRGLTAARQAAAHLGQRAIGTIATGDENLVEWLLSEAELSGVVYWEVLGLLPPDAERELLERTRRLVRRWKGLERPGGMRIGLSPHATYSLSPGLLRGLVELAAGEGLPVQIHAAESPAEAEYFKSGGGPIASFFRSRGLPTDLHPRGLSPIEYLAENDVLKLRPVLVHGVQVNDSDVRLLAEAGTPLVSCPRSNVNLQCGLPPYELYRARGVRLALGTDSHASAESLDVRDEIRFLSERGLDPVWLLTAAVAGGHQLLGLNPPRIGAGTPLRQVEFW